MSGLLSATILKYTSLSLLVALLITGAWGTWGWSRADHWKGKFTTEHREFGAFKIAIIDKTAEYLTKAKLAQKERDEENARKAVQAQAGFDSLYQRYRGIVRQQASGSAIGGDHLPQASGAAGVPAGSATGAVISITEDDAMICADNTAKAVAAYRWAESFTQPYRGE